MGAGRPGRSRSGRWAAWIGALGVLIIAVALVAPGPQGAGASPKASAQAERPSALVAARQPAPPVAVHAQVALKLIVAPADGGNLAVYDAPDAPAPSQVLPSLNELGAPLALLAVASEGDWYQVLLTTRPNGSSAWVPASAVTVTAPAYKAELSLSTLELHVVRISDGAVVLSSPIGIGAPSSPTPTGLFFVREHFPTGGGDSHPYGPFAFGLSGHSEVHMQFGTGDGRIAIHGTNQPSSIGAAASNGCVHVPNDVVLALIPFLPQGAPVNITA